MKKKTSTNFKNRILATVLSLVMICGLLPGTVSAADGDVTFTKTSAIEAGKEYLIVANSSSGSSYALANDSSNMKLSVNSYLSGDGNTITLPAADAAKATWVTAAATSGAESAAGEFTFTNSGNKLARTTSTNAVGFVTTTDKYSGMSYDQGTLKNIGSNDTPYYLGYGSVTSGSSYTFRFATGTTSNIVFYVVNSGAGEDPTDPTDPIDPIEMTPTTANPSMSATITVGDTLKVKITNGSTNSAYDFNASSGNENFATVSPASQNIAAGASVEYTVTAVAVGNTAITFSNENPNGSSYNRMATLNLTVISAGTEDPGDPTTPDDSEVYVGFTSDVHGNLTGLENWFNNLPDQVALEYMSYAGDYSYAGTIDSYISDFTGVVSRTEGAPGLTSAIYTTGNHEWGTPFSGSTLNSSFTNEDDFLRIGEAANETDFTIYTFGAAGWYNGIGEFPESDITELSNYLQTADEDEPIFIVSHFPIHYISSRAITNADKLIELLNQYPNVVFLWGHNHSQSSETNYGKYFLPGDSITYANGQSAEINFTYLSAGAMTSNSPSRSPYNGLVAKVTEDGSKVSFYYYNNGTTVTETVGPTINIGDGEGPGEDPDDPEYYTYVKATNIEADKEYLIVSGGYALRTDLTAAAVTVLSDSIQISADDAGNYEWIAVTAETGASDDTSESFGGEFTYSTGTQLLRRVSGNTGIELGSGGTRRCGMSYDAVANTFRNNGTVNNDVKEWFCLYYTNGGFTFANPNVTQNTTLYVKQDSTPTEPTKTLTGISVTNPPTKTTYIAGEIFDPTGMVVTAEYSDSSSAAVTGYTIMPSGALATMDTSVTISYTEGSITETAIQDITVNAEDPDDPEYYTYVKATNIEADKEYLIVSGGYALRTDLTASAVTILSDDSIDISADDAGNYEWIAVTAKTGASDDESESFGGEFTYSTGSQLLGRIAGNTSIILGSGGTRRYGMSYDAGANTFINKGADKGSGRELFCLYYTNGGFTFANPGVTENTTLYVKQDSTPTEPTKTLTGISITNPPTKTTYIAGEIFDPTGMVVTAEYSDSSSTAVTGYTVTPSGALATTDTSVTISYTEGSVTETAIQAITVNTETLVSISVTTLPTKVTYLEAKDVLDVTGGKITLYYDNDTSKEIDMTSDMVSGFNNTVLGQQALAVTYGGKTNTFYVEIVAKSLASIAVTTNPTKLEYLEAKEDLDVTGGMITLTYDNGTTDEIAITYVMVSGFDNTVAGTQTLTVTYGGKTGTFDVEIIAKSVDSISVATNPTKLEYIEAKDVLDVTGGKITLYYNNDTSEVIDMTSDMVTGFDNTVLGIQTLTVTYQEKTTTFDVEVIAKSLASISVSTNPTKLEYLQAKDNLDITGGKITLTYDNGTTEVIDMTSDMVTGFDNTVVGNQALTVTYQSKTTTFDVEVIKDDTVTVFAGSDRYATSVEISRASYDSADCAILALGTNFPDALAGGPLAFAEKAPILLIKAEEIPEVTQDELTRLGVTRVIILGGTAGIGTAVEKKLEDMGITFERLAGADRYITAVEIAEALREKTGEGDTAVIACGTNFPDALSIGSYAAKSGIPILLSRSGDLPDATAEALKDLGITKVIIMGGTVSISGSVQAEIVSMGITVTRISGSDRYSTGVAVAEKYHSSSVHAVIANGTNFPDALSAVPYAAMYNAPILLVKTDDIPDSVSVYISGSSIKTVSSAGGTAVVGTAVLTELESLLS